MPCNEHTRYSVKQDQTDTKEDTADCKSTFSLHNRQDRIYTRNELPFSLRDTGLSLTTFNEHLKTYSFSVAFWDHGAFVTFMIYLRRL